MEVHGDSQTSTTDAVTGTNAIANGTGAGVHGVSKNAGPGVIGESVDGRGVQGLSTNNFGIRAHSVKRAGLWATSAEGPGIQSNSTNFEGVAGGSIKGNGVAGTSNTGSGVFGASESGAGVFGKSETGRGLAGFSTTGQAVFGHSTIQAGVVGVSEKFIGVWGESKSVDQPGVFGIGKLAGRFDGDVEVSGDIKLTGGSDIAERFSVTNAEAVLPGCVMAFTEDGAIQPCHQSYDKKAAGVVSGAGKYKPGLLLGNDGAESGKMPIALMGKVFCCVDADFGSVEVGDLLTTSSTTGYAMKAIDVTKAFGAVIGKALQPLKAGKGLIPILVALQ